MKDKPLQMHSVNIDFRDGVSTDGFPPLPEGERFDLIVADPPWKYISYSAKGYDRAPEKHYKTQPLDWICNLPIKDLAAKNTHLMLWINGPSLVAGYHIPVMRAWGFKPSSMAFVWLKPKKGASNPRMFAPAVTDLDFIMGLGKTTRQNAEYVLLGRRGSPRRHSKAIHQLIIEPRREHSRKPEEFYRRAAEYAGDGARKLELFTRTPRVGWTVWGDEAHKYSPA
ncbi:MT-A70 family methyltransferase (plasmid) [Brucella anthropi]|uniref:MT-A70 family methyltransferase n=1 Tax=Brucella anthropi TaxID=529 RepID=UPI003D7C975E